MMTPTLPAVAHVHGSWSTKDFRRVLVLVWKENGSPDTQVETLTEGVIAAYETWKEQAKVPTPFERAEGIVDMLAVRGVHRGTLEAAGAQSEIEAVIERALAANREDIREELSELAALRLQIKMYKGIEGDLKSKIAMMAADRQERALRFPVPDEDHGGDVAPTPAQTARAIVADWANAHRTHYADADGFGTAPDSGNASLDDLQHRIAAALAEQEAR